MADFIEKFLEHSKNLPTPESFRTWSAISAVGMALERKVWIPTQAGNTYPNLYVLLAAPPAVGKGAAIESIMEICRRTKKIKVAPESMTKASLLDCLEGAKKELPFNGHKLSYHSLAIMVEEFGTLVPAHDTEFLNTLIALYNNKALFEETRRHSKSTVLENPQLSMLAGSQPSYLAHLLPEEAWGMGFMSRMMIIYTHDAVDWDVFAPVQDTSKTKEELVNILSRICNAYGAMAVSNDFKKMYNDWKNMHWEPAPVHSKLEHYSKRRPLLLLKLSIISAHSRGEEKCVDKVDFERAQYWMLEAERRMPDLFRDMVHKSDSETIKELCYFLWQLHSADKNKNGIHSERLVAFLSNRIPAERISRILEIAEKGGYISRLAGTDMYIPKPKTIQGVE